MKRISSSCSSPGYHVCIFKCHIQPEVEKQRTGVSVVAGPGAAEAPAAARDSHDGLLLQKGAVQDSSKSSYNVSGWGTGCPEECEGECLDIRFLPLWEGGKSAEERLKEADCHQCSIKLRVFERGIHN